MAFYSYLAHFINLDQDASDSYMLNMRSEEYNTVFYSYLARFMNTVTLNMNMFLSNTVFTRRNTLFILLWLRLQEYLNPIQHVGSDYPVRTPRVSLIVPL